MPVETPVAGAMNGPLPSNFSLLSSNAGRFFGFNCGLFNNESLVINFGVEKSSPSVVVENSAGLSIDMYLAL
uniref:Uncharacterized protein n=1 Tax=Romanomermis culicivorax TaxID=13658 RepID=A0A915L7M1_ROMCU